MFAKKWGKSARRKPGDASHRDYLDLKSDLGITLIGVVKDLPREEWGWEEVRGLGCRVAGMINRGS